MVKTSSGSVALTAVAIAVALLATSVASSTLVEPAYAKKTVAPGEKNVAYCFYYENGASSCSTTMQQCEQSREEAIANEEPGYVVSTECIKEKPFYWPP